MGTSGDRDGGKGGAWTPLKRAATDLAKSAGSGGGSADQVNRLLGRSVAVLGGSAAAAGSAVGGTAGLSGLGGFLSAFAEGGLPEALQFLGLERLIGSDRFDILDELVTALSGDGGDLESQAARDAECDVLDELFGEADDWSQLESVTVTGLEVSDLLSSFLARYIYNRIPAIGERLARNIDPVAARREDLHIIQMIRDVVELKLPDNALSDFDWSGPAGREFAELRITEIYRILEAFGDENV